MQRNIGVLSPLIVVLAAILIGCPEKKSEPVLLTSFTLSPTSSLISVGQTQQFVVQGFYSDNSSRDITSEVQWQSSDTAVASIAGSGLATAVAVGQTTIKAVLDQRSAEAVLTINIPQVVTQTASRLSGVIYGNGMFVVVGSHGDWNGSILTSTDGNSWTSTSVGSALTGGVAYGNGTFVASPNEYNKVLMSTDGITWTHEPAGPSVFLHDIQYVNGLFLSSGGNGKNECAMLRTLISCGYLFSSSDGITWIARENLGVLGSLSGFSYGNATFVAVGYDFSNQGILYISSNGADWARQYNDVLLNRVAFGNGVFVAVGGDYVMNTAIMRTSADGVVWQDALLPNAMTGRPLEAITYGNGLFVAVGQNGMIVTSPDGTTWTLRNSGTGIALSGVAYGSGLFVATGGNNMSGVILTSSDGITWSVRL